jgi:hypothetical protein
MDGNMLDSKQDNRISDYKNTKIPPHDKKIVQKFLAVRHFFIKFAFDLD